MREAFKAGFEVIAWVLVAPLALPVKWCARLDQRDALFTFGAELLAPLPGGVGVFLRRAYYHIVLASGAPGLHIGFCSTLAQRGVALGRNVYIGAHCSIGLSRIDDDVLIGSHVSVISGARVHEFTRTDVPIRLQGGRLEAITIGRDSWLANHAVVLAPVGEGCVIGAGAVVVAACAPFGVYVGNPARRVRDRRGDAVAEVAATGDPG